MTFRIIGGSGIPNVTAFNSAALSKPRSDVSHINDGYGVKSEKQGVRRLSD